MADFERIFHVTPLWEVEEQPGATELLNQNIVWEESRYHKKFGQISAMAGKVAEFFENLQHKDKNQLYVKWESKKTGFGLYTRVPFKAGDIVDLYTGVLYEDWEYLNNYIDTDYTWNYPSKTGNYPHGVEFGVDARLKGNYMRFSNHAGNECNSDAFFLPYNNRWNVFYVAIKDIPAGAAITTDYGSSYFETRPLV